MVTFFKESAVSPAVKLVKYSSILFIVSENGLMDILIGKN